MSAPQTMRQANHHEITAEHNHDHIDNFADKSPENIESEKLSRKGFHGSCKLAFHHPSPLSIHPFYYTTNILQCKLISKFHMMSSYEFDLFMYSVSVNINYVTQLSELS